MNPRKPWQLFARRIACRNIVGCSKDSLNSLRPIRTRIHRGTFQLVLVHMTASVRSSGSLRPRPWLRRVPRGISASVSWKSTIPSAGSKQRSFLRPEMPKGERVDPIENLRRPADARRGSRHHIPSECGTPPALPGPTEIHRSILKETWQKTALAGDVKVSINT